MSTSSCPILKQRFFDQNGLPLSGGQLFSYLAGTSTPAATYTDETGGTANANPIILDSNGQCDCWLDESVTYKFVLQDSLGVTQWTVDNVSSNSGSGTNVTNLNDSNIAANAAINRTKLATATPSRVVVNDSSGNLSTSAVTSTELSYLSGTTSAVQTQINAKMTNPMTNTGDVIIGGSSGTPTRLAAGSANTVLTSAGAGAAPTWSAVPAPTGLTNTNISSSAAIQRSKLAAGTANKAVVEDGSGNLTDSVTTATEISYLSGTTSAVQTQIDSKLTNPMTTAGDLIVGGASGAPTRVAAGTSSYVLTSNGAGAAPSWQAALTNPMTTTGDLIVGGSSGTPTRVAAGTSTYVLTSNGAGVAPTWQAAPGLSGTVAIANGGTGQTTQQAAIDALAGTQSSGKYLRSDGTHTTLTTIQAGDVPTLNQNTTGTSSNVTGTVAIANGGSGQTTQQLAINALTGTQGSGKYLRSDGTNATLATIQAGDVPTLNQNTTGTASNVTGTVAIANGGTGQTTAANAINALLPTQTSQSGNFLTTNGTVASWAATTGLTNPMTTGGDIIYGGASGAATRLANGSSGNFLMSNGGTSAPSWGTPSTTASLAITTKTGTYTVLTSDNVVLCSGAAFTVTLYTASGNSGKQVMIKKTDSSLSNVISITTLSSQTIDGINVTSTPLTLATQNESVTVVSDGTNWQILSHAIPTSWQNAGAVTIKGSGGDPTKGTMTTDAFYWKRNGTNMDFRYLYNQSTGGSNGSGDYSFTIPVSGATIDTTKLVVNTTVYGASNEVGADTVGVATLITATTARSAGYVYVATSTTLKIWIPGTAVFASVSGISGTTCVTMNGSVPITNWWV